MEQETALIDGDDEVRLPADWWSAVLRSVADGEHRVVVEDEAGNRYVVVSESRFRALEDAERATEAARPRVALTAREREVLHMIGEGCPGSVVAERLGLAPNTVAQHLAAVRRKYGVRSSAAAVVAARADGLLD